MSASLLVGLLLAVVLAVVGAMAARNKTDASPRNKAMWSLASWTVVVVMGLAIWLVARAQLSR